MTTVTKAFIDATCQKCGESIGWFGDFTDRPPCPRCGSSPPMEEQRKLQERMDRDIHLITMDITEATPAELELLRRLAGLPTVAMAARQLGIEKVDLQRIEAGELSLLDLPDVAAAMKRVYQQREEEG